MAVVGALFTAQGQLVRRLPPSAADGIAERGRKKEWIGVICREREKAKRGLEGRTEKG